MASTKVTVPDFQFSGFYYAEILARLRQFNRINAPEITSEEPEEPFIQLERAFALVGHYNNVLLDFVANEVFLPTLKLQDSARNALALIDFRLRDYSPATTELLLELAQVPTTSVTVLDADTLFETERSEESEPVPFENVDSAVVVGPSNVVDGAFGLEFDRTGSDGSTVAGDATAFESASIAATADDVGKVIELSGSILGNNGVFQIVEYVSATRVRLGGAFGGDAPLFIAEGATISWTVRAFGADGSTEVNGVGTWTPWASGPAVGDTFYFGSKYAMFSKFGVVLDTAAANVTGVWEYWDPDEEDENPDSVTNLGTTLRFDVNDLLGTDDRRGAFVRVTYLPTGQSELLVSTWTSPNNRVTTTAFLGQSGTPSTDPQDYAVGVTWQPLPNQDDATFDLTVDADVEYDLPQTLRANWQKTTVQAVEGFWVRYRVVSSASPTAPVIDGIDVAGGTQYLLVDATQGETVDSEALVSSDGSASQTFELSQTPGLRDTVQVYVDEGGGEVEWTNLTAAGKTLLTSDGNDRHFEVRQDSTGRLTVAFGDGTRGKIPALGVDVIRFEYRVSAAEDGNVGVDTITVNSDGPALVASVTNPRPAAGWREADGASDASLALVKEEGPASLRTLGRAVSPSDYEDLAVNFTTSAGVRPVVRAKAIEEGYGPKTVKLVVVGVNGTQITSSVKTELEEYFNGNLATQVEGVGQANHEVTVVTYSARLIAYTVVVRANEALSEAAVRTALAALVSPTSLESDGQTYTWRFGGRVPNSRVAAEVFSLSAGNVFDVDVSVPAADQELSEVELPLLDSGNLTVTLIRE